MCEYRVFAYLSGLIKTRLHFQSEPPSDEINGEAFSTIYAEHIKGADKMKWLDWINRFQYIAQSQHNNRADLFKDPIWTMVLPELDADETEEVVKKLRTACSLGANLVMYGLVTKLVKNASRQLLSLLWKTLCFIELESKGNHTPQPKDFTPCDYFGFDLDELKAKLPAIAKKWDEWRLANKDGKDVEPLADRVKKGMSDAERSAKFDKWMEKFTCDETFYHLLTAIVMNNLDVITSVDRMMAIIVIGMGTLCNVLRSMFV